MIASGEKTTEYREETPYWRNRLKKPFTTVLFQLGYERASPRLLANIVSIALVDGHYEIAVKNVQGWEPSRVYSSLSRPLTRPLSRRMGRR